MTHIDDGQLIALIDGALPGEDTRIAEVHLDRCAVCRAARDRLAGRLERFGALLRAEEGRVESKRRWAFTHDRRAVLAAGIALTIAVATTAPVRAWLVDGWSEPKTGTVPDAVSESVSTLRFPSERSLVVSFGQRQASGHLTIESTSGRMIEWISTDSTVELVLVDGRLEVENNHGTRGDYALRVPASHVDLAVFVEGTEVWTSSTEALDSARIPVGRR